MSSLPNKISGFLSKENLSKEIKINDPKIVDIFSFFLIELYLLFPLLENIYSGLFKATMYDLSSNWNYIVAVLGTVLLIIKIRNSRPTKTDIKDYLKRNPIIILFVCFFMWIIISSLFNLNNPYLFFGTLNQKEGILTFTGYIIYFFLAMYIDEKYQKHLLRTIVAVSGIVCLLYIIFMLSGQTILTFADNLALFANCNHSAYYMNVAGIVAAVSFMLSKDTKTKIISMISFVLNAEALLLNNTLGALIGMIVGLMFSVLVISLCKKKLTLYPLVFIAIMALLVFLNRFICPDLYNQTVSSFVRMFSDASQVSKGKDSITGHEGSGRLALWLRTIDYIKERPIVGFGPDGTAERLSMELKTINTRVHNEYLYYAVSFGIPGLLLYLSCILNVYFRGLFNRDRLSTVQIVGLTAAFAYFVSAFFGNTKWYSAPYAYIMLGLGYYIKGSKEYAGE